MRIAARGRALVAVALGLSAARTVQAQAGQLAPAQILSLVAAAPSVLGVTVLSGAAQTIPSLTDNAVNNFPSPVVVRTNWNLQPGQSSSVELVAYFAVPAQALTGGSTQIASSRVLGRMTTGLPAAYTAMTAGPVAGAGTAGGSLHLFSQSISGSNKVGNRTDNLDLALDLVGFPSLPAGAYSGTLTIQAVTQ
ncbi:MAG TPA: hypothetical protein VF046_02195 [Gemmatimonadales bacterium]